MVQVMAMVTAVTAATATVMVKTKVTANAMENSTENSMVSSTGMTKHIAHTTIITTMKMTSPLKWKDRIVKIRKGCRNASLLLLQDARIESLQHEVASGLDAFLKR